MGAVVFMQMEAYQRFLDGFERTPSAADGAWTHLRAFDGEETLVDLTGRIDESGQTLTLGARTLAILGQDLVLAVNVSHAATTRRTTRDLLAAAGLDREETLDVITQLPVEEWFDPVDPAELRVAFENWVAIARPSVLILTRAALEDKHTAGKAVLRGVPPSMRLVTPVLVITELVADGFNRVLHDHGIAPMETNSVLVLVWDGQVREWHRTARARGTERALTSAVGEALSWVGEQLEEAHALASSVLDDEETEDTATLRAALTESETKQRALTVQLANARAETKQANGERWVLERELQLIRDRDHDEDEVDGSADDSGILPTPVADIDPQPWSHLPELPESTFSSMLPRTRETFGHLVIDGAIDKAIQPLDNHPKRDTWLLRTWSVLGLLDDYAAAKLSGDPAGTFRGWLESRPQHPMIRPAHVRSGETLSMRGGKYGEARTFVVPTSVNPSGRALFLAHIHIEPGKVRPNPRLHYLDDTAAGASGRIYVGHLGAHLTTRRTN